MSENCDCSTSLNGENGAKKHDLNFCDIAVDFERLRLSALTNAAEISPQVKNVTIGPNSPMKKEILRPIQNTISKMVPKTETIPKEVAVDDLQYTAALKMYDQTLKENSEIIFNDLIYKMLAKRAEYMKQYWIKQSKACEYRALELKSRKLQMLKDLQENVNLSVVENSKQNEQNSEYMHMKTMESMNRILEEQSRAATQFAAITNSHTKICICYNDISNLLENDKYANKVSHKFMKLINSTVNEINKLMDFSKNGNVTEEVVQQAELLALRMDSIKKHILDECSLLEEQDRRLNEELEAEQRRIEEAKLKEQQAKEEVAMKTTTETLFYSAQNYARYEELKKFLELYENSNKQFLEDVSIKKFRFDCQKAVNTPVNSIASVSGTHLRDKYEKLSRLLKGEQVQVLDIYVTATQHPQGLNFCTALLAKKIVLQGASLVSSQPEAAFPLAAITVALWAQFPDLGNLIEANFHRACPYLVPMFLPQKQGMTDKDFYLSRGYTYSPDGVIEKQDKFLKRMSGIFTLNCAIWISKPPKFLNASNPHGLRFGWKWLASFINLKPEPDICATLLHDFFTVCGSEFNLHYKSQFRKMIKLIIREYICVLEKIDEGGPKTRLEVLLQNILKTGHLPPPSGKLPPNIW